MFAVQGSCFLLMSCSIGFGRQPKGMSRLTLIKEATARLSPLKWLVSLIRDNYLLFLLRNPGNIKFAHPPYRCGRREWWWTKIPVGTRFRLFIALERILEWKGNVPGLNVVNTKFFVFACACLAESMYYTCISSAKCLGILTIYVPIQFRCCGTYMCCIEES